MKYEHKGVSLTSDQEIPTEEAQRYIERGLERHPTLKAIVASVDGDFVGLEYHFTKHHPLSESGESPGTWSGLWTDGTTESVPRRRTG